VLLAVSEFLPITHTRTITVVLPGSERSGLEQNSGALTVLGLLALPMLVVLSSGLRLLAPGGGGALVARREAALALDPAVEWRQPAERGSAGGVRS
jgi:hypothetical protein